MILPSLNHLENNQQTSPKGVNFSFGKRSFVDRILETFSFSCEKCGKGRILSNLLLEQAETKKLIF